MRRQEREDGTGQIMPLLSAGLVFLATVGTIVYTTSEQVVDPDPVDQAVRQAEAEALMSVLMDSGGKGWELGGDDVERLGMLSAEGGLSLSKMDLMQGAVFSITPSNELVDYDEARDSLGLPQEGAGQRDFHLRIYPIGMQRNLGLMDVADVRTAYIGHWNEFAAVTVSLDTPENMVAEARAELEVHVDRAPYAERRMLDDLGVDMKNRLHLSTHTPYAFVDLGVTEAPLHTVASVDLLQGDVFPDDADFLSETLPSRLDRYDLLVIGSRVEHQAMTQSSVKHTIRDWVLDGGMLVVLGSGGSNTNWLQPLFHVSTSTVNGAPYVNDPSHPLLVTPHALDWRSYSDSGIAWDLAERGRPAVLEDFDHVIQNEGLDVLAVSKEGAFGEGRVFLTSFEPHVIAKEVGRNEAEDLLHNIIVYADKEDLYLDYGPPVPEGVHTAGAVRNMFIEDDDVGVVPVRVEVLIW